MKIVLNTQNVDLINYFTRISRGPVSFPAGYEDKKVEIQHSRVENGLFESISDPSVDVYLIGVPSSYSQKAVDFIKKKTPYIPVILFGATEKLAEISGADIYLPYCSALGDEEKLMARFFDLAVWNASNYLKNFAKLRKLTTKMSESIEFGQCVYDPTRRTLSYKDKELKKLSAKEGGILEILASNFGEVVKKEIVLEKVWHKSDYFSGRSMDVYVTHLRRLLRDNEVGMTINNISGVGLILE